MPSTQTPPRQKLKPQPSRPTKATGAGTAGKRNLLRFTPVKRLVNWRGFQFAVQLPNVLVYLLVILTGFYGTQEGGKNFATVITWIVWWSAIVFTFVFVGRLWCLMCPFSAMAEWLQRLSLWSVKSNTFGLGWKWPQKLRNLYPATVLFLILTWVDHQFGLVGSPLYTAYFVLVMLALATLVMLLFERRTFCRYICPIGGLIGIYSLFASAELRVANREVCRGHKEKNCLVGRGGKGYGCPVGEYPGNMDNNAFCTLCTECMKTCPKDNITFRFRSFAHDLANLTEKRLGLDMSILAVVLLGLPAFQTIIMAKAWDGWISKLQELSGLHEIVVFTSVFLASTLLVPLGLFFGTSAVTKMISPNKDVTLRRVFVNFAFAFVPIGLFMHLAHNVKHLFGESYLAVPVLSDPFGWGWDLFGTAGSELSSPFSNDLLAEVQFALVIVGQGCAVYVGYRIARRLFGPKADRFFLGMAPMLILTVAWSLFNIWVLNVPMMDRH